MDHMGLYIFSEENYKLHLLDDYSYNYVYYGYLGKPIDRHEFNKLFNSNALSPLSNEDKTHKQQEEEVDQEEEENYVDNDPWSSDTGERGRKRKKNEGQAEMSITSMKEERIEKRKWYSSEPRYEEYLQMSKLYGLKMSQFCIISYGSKDAKKVYHDFKKKECMYDMPYSEAMKLIKLGMWANSSLDKTNHWFQCVPELLSLVPCITTKTEERSKHFAKPCISLGIFPCTMHHTYQYLDEIFKSLEPVFHPFIRKEIMKDVIWITKRDARIERRKEIQSNKDSLFLRGDGPLIETISSKAYQDAIQIVKAHHHFDRHLAHCSLLNETSKIKDIMDDTNVVPIEFRKLDDSLIKASLSARVRLLRKLSEYKRYVAWIIPFLKLKANTGYSILDEILEEVREVYPSFPKLPEECILDEKQEELSSFCEQVSKIKYQTRCPASNRYVVEGILAYKDISRFWKLERRQQKLKYWLANCMMRLEALKRVWGTAHYDHHAYTTLIDNFCN